MEFINLEPVNEILLTLRDQKAMSTLGNCLYVQLIQGSNWSAIEAEVRGTERDSLKFDLSFLARVFADSSELVRSNYPFDKMEPTGRDFVKFEDEAGKILENVKVPDARRIMLCFQRTVETCPYRPDSDFDLGVAFRFLAMTFDKPILLPLMLDEGDADYFF